MDKNNNKIIPKKSSKSDKILIVILILLIIVFIAGLIMLGVILNSKNNAENKNGEGTTDKAENKKDKDTSNASKPTLGNLIPVVYKNNSWIVSNTEDEWYDYSNQEWANAVLLKSGVTKKIGDTINVENEVQGMFVWIPRYEYKIEGQYGTHSDGTKGTIELPGEIEIKFISKTKIAADTGYRVHPAFNFGGTNVEGFWVGKFETSPEKTSACYINDEDLENKNDLEILEYYSRLPENCLDVTPYIIPNARSLTYQNVSTQFATAQKFNITSHDSHMAKKSEWEAVAYLSQSRYGKYGNPNYTGAEKEVRLNNCSSLITGVGANSQNEVESADTCITNTYTTANGMSASTTGNITGVYDMSGGANEYVMGVYRGSDSFDIWGAGSIKGINLAGFPNPPDSKYFDVETNLSPKEMCNGDEDCYRLVDDRRNWYLDSAGYVSKTDPWYMMGLSYSGEKEAGIFSISGFLGSSDPVTSFRVIAVPTE